MPLATVCPDAEFFARVGDNALSADEIDTFAAHLETCASCGDRVGAVRVQSKLVDALRGHARDLPVDKHLQTLMSRLEQLPPDSATATATTGSELDSVDGRKQDVSDDFRALLSPSQTPGELGCLGPYGIKKLLGMGGMGMVFEAEDRQLRRLVALKVVRPALASKPGARERFLREARAAAALTHEHIVTIYQVGEENGAPYLAMQLLQGMSLDKLLRAAGGPLAVSQALSIGRQIARGLAAAHARNLIHRDIKPANIWLESNEQGNDERGMMNDERQKSQPDDGRRSSFIIYPSSFARVKILDFGLARSAAAEEGPDVTPLTQVGTILGTPAYMAPEQARGQVVDARADLFSLGCVLYEMTTGTKPFTGRDAMALLSSLALDTPPAARQRNAQVPAALSELIERLLEKDPARRPASAQEVAAALETIERSQPEAPARDRGAQTQTSAALTLAGAAGSEKPARPRRRLAAWLAAAAALLVVAGGIVVIIRDRDGNEVARVKVPPGGKVEVEDDRKAEAKGSKEKGIEPPRLAASPCDLLRREAIPAYELAAAGDGDPKKALPELVAVLGDSRLKQWAEVQSVALSRDGKLLASSGTDGAVRLWDPVTGKALRTLHYRVRRYVNAVAISPDGRTVASGDSYGFVSLWEAATGKLQRTLEGLTQNVASIAFSSDGQIVAVAQRSSPIKLWEVGTGKLKRTIKAPTNLGGFGRSLAFSPVDTGLAAGCEDSKVYLWDTATGNLKRTFTGHTKGVIAVAFSPDGKTLASSSEDGTVRIWVSATGESKRTLATGALASLAFSADGQTLAGSHANHHGYVQLWDLASGEKRTVHHAGPVFSLSFAGKGNMLATAGGSGVVKLWDAGTGAEIVKLTDAAGSVVSVTVSPDGRTVAIAGNDTSVRLWDLCTGRAKPPLLHDQMTTGVTFSPDGKLLATSGRSGVWLWDVATGECQRKIRDARTFDWLHRLAFSPDGRTLAWGQDDGQVKLFDLMAGDVRQGLKGHTAPVCCVAFSPNGEVLASGGADKTVRVWDLKTGKERHRDAEHKHRIEDVAFSPDGQTLAVVAYATSAVRLWDIATGKLQREVNKEAEPSTSVAFSPDGKTLAFGTDDATVTLWNPHDGRRRRSYRLQPRGAGRVGAVAFTPDGRHLITGNGNGTLYVLRLRENPDGIAVPAGPARASGRPLSPLALVTRPAPLPGVRSWTIETAHARAGPSSLCSPLALNRDGSRLALAGEDGTLRIFDVKSGRLLRALLGHQTSIAQIAWTRDGQWLASADQNETFIWDTSTWRMHQRIAANRLVAWSPDGAKLAVGRERAIVWNVATGRGVSVPAAYPAAFAWSPDGKTLALGHSFGAGISLYEVDAAVSKVREWKPPPGQSIVRLAWSPDGATLAAIINGFGVRLWDPATGQPKGPAKHNYVNNADLAWTPDGKKLLSGQILGDPLTGDAQYAQEFKEGGYQAFSGDGHVLAICDSDFTKLGVYDWASRHKMLSMENHPLIPYDGPGYQIAPAGKRLAAVFEGRSARTWNTENGQQLAAFGDAIAYPSFSSDGGSLLLQARSLKGWRYGLFKTDTLLPLKELPASAYHQGQHAALSPDQKTLIVNTNDQKEQLVVDASTFAVRKRLATPPAPNFSWSPDGTMLALGNLGGEVQILDTATWALRQKLELPQFATRLFWSGDGKNLAVFHFGNSVAVFDVASGKLTRPFQRGYTGASGSHGIHWLPDNKSFLVVTQDGRLRRIDLGRPDVLELRPLPATGSRALITPDGRTVATTHGGYLATLWFWKTASGRPTGVLTPLSRERSLAVSPDGHYRGTAGVESELVYVVETDKGQETLTPTEFAQRYGWKNDPAKVRLLGDNVTDQPDIEPLPPPHDAAVLFDGSNLDAWRKATGKVVDGFLETGADDLVSKEKFGGPFRLHVEFRLPPRAPVANAPGSPKDAPGSPRSGIFVQGRYLLPISDSDGQPPNDTTTTGAIYRKKAPSSVMPGDSPARVSHPAGVWQSLEIDFEPPLGENGKVKASAKLTVRHNGFTIHDRYAAAPTERAYDYKETEPGPVVLQGNTAGIQFRNVWVQPTAAAAK